MAETHAPDGVVRALRPVLDSLGLALYDVEVAGGGRSRTLRVLIDRDGGVDLDAVTAATEALAPVLDRDPAVGEALPGSYLLEVSSPGLERTLRTPEHFRGAVGSPISLKARDADGTVTRRRVLLVDADDRGIVVEDDERADGGRAEVAYDDVVQARTVFDWGPAPKPGSKAAKARRSKPTVSASSHEDARR